MAMIDPTEFDLDESQEPYALKPGEEHKLVIVGVTEGTDKNDLKYLLPRLEVVGEPYAKDFTYFLHVPDRASMTEKQLNRVRFNYRTFCACFGIDNSRPHDPVDEWPGHEGYAILGASSDDQYGEQNFVKKFITPQ
jgi:hypothetical protein